MQVTASATGFDTGVATLGITDVDLPDLTVTSVTAPASAYNGTPLSISWTVVNGGLYPASGAWLDQVYFDPVGGSPSTTPADTVPFTGTLNAGQTYTQTDTLLAPAAVGQYVVRIVADADQSVQELSFSNNTFTRLQPVTVQAAYQVTVQTTATTVPNGTPIVLTGVRDDVKQRAQAASVPVAIDESWSLARHALWTATT